MYSLKCNICSARTLEEINYCSSTKFHWQNEGGKEISPLIPQNLFVSTFSLQNLFRTPQILFRTTQL